MKQEESHDKSEHTYITRSAVGALAADEETKLVLDFIDSNNKARQHQKELNEENDEDVPYERMLTNKYVVKSTALIHVEDSQSPHKLDLAVDLK